MIACVCPAATVRSTPRRISLLSPACPATATCRSRISRMATIISSSVLASRGGHEDVVALDPHLVDGERLAGRWSGRLPRAHVEAGAVQPALDRVVVDLAVGERHLFMGA